LNWSSITPDPVSVLLNATFGDALAQKIISSDVYKVDDSDTDAVLNAAYWMSAHDHLLLESRIRTGRRNGNDREDNPADKSTYCGSAHPKVCYPNSVYNASCHTSDILLAWGTLNTKTEDVRPYYDDREPNGGI
jgi:acetylcholinesterase